MEEEKMMEKAAADNVAAIKAVEKKEEKMVFKFSKPYLFEKEKYTEIDLSGLKNINGEMLVEAEKYYSSDGDFSAVPELTMACALFFASKATDKPIEFFQRMPASEAIKLRNRVRAFLRDAD